LSQPFPAYQGDEPYVFVCYAHDDSAVVYPEMQWLRDQGVNVWYDEGISAGKVWRAEIAEAIQGAAKFLYYISATSLASAHCNREVNYALDRDFEVLPVYLEDVDLTAELDLALNRVQALHRDQDANYEQHLLHALGQSSAVEPKPIVAELIRSDRSSIRPGLAVGLAVTTLLCIAALTWYLVPREESPGVLAGDALAPIRSIAVLPLENLSGDPDQEYVADGMTEELIGTLAKLGSLNVISRTSVMRYKERTKSIPEIAAELGVEGVLEGTVTREQNRFRITVQLIDARMDMHLWADQFDREQSSVLALRSDVARAVAEQIRLELTPEEDAALTSSQRVNPLAYDAYLRGLQLRGPTSLINAWAQPALEQFEQAVALDPNFAEAWVMVGQSRVALGQIDGAREAVERALELNDRLGVAYAMLAFMAGVAVGDFAEERRAAERAIQLSPNHPAALSASAASLVRHGRLSEALRVSERIPLVAPFDGPARAGHLGRTYFTRHYERTLEEAKRVRVLIPGWQDTEEPAAYEKLGRHREAYDARLAFYEQCGAPCDPLRAAAERGWAQGGPAGALRAEIVAGKDSPLGVVLIPVDYAVLGETDEAIAWLERGYQERSVGMWMTSIQPLFDTLRWDSRFDDLLSRMGFPGNESPAMLADVGGTLALAGRAEEAIARLDEALQLAPGDERLPRWRYYMAMAHFAAERYEQSVSWAQRALEDEASSHTRAFSHLLLASCQAYLGRFDESRESLVEALRLWPDVAINWDLSALFMAGDPVVRDRYLDGLRKAGMDG